MPVAGPEVGSGTVGLLGGFGGGAAVPKNLVIGGASESVSTIEIPALSGSPDIAVPAGAGNSQYNDEFDENASGAPTGWTSFGTPATLNTTDALSNLHIATASAANAICGVYRAVTLTYPATITIKISDYLFGTASQVAGVLVSPVAPGNAGTGAGVDLPSGINGQNGTVNMSTLAYTGVANGLVLQIPGYLKLTMSDSTHVSMLGARSGFNYQGWSSGSAVLGAAAAFVVLFVCAQGAANGAAAFFDFIRFS